jgi:hypothetical protein
MLSPSFMPGCQRKLGQFTRSGSLGLCTCEHMLSFLCYCHLLAKICNVSFFRPSHAGLLPLARMIKATSEDAADADDDHEQPKRSRCFPCD